MAISGTTWNISELTLKNKTASEWTSANPTLKKGEIGIESDTGKFKLGDGSKNWTSLPYATYTVSEITTALASKANTSAIPSIVDNLTSTSTTAGLSANQGRVLNGKIPAVVNNLTTTTTGSALDAVQGKTLKDTIAAFTADEAGNHNANYIEKDAGAFTAEISSNIRNGSFKGLYPGHYFSFNVVPYDYYWPTSDTTAQAGKTYYADAIGTPLDTQPEAGSDISGNEYTEKFSATHTGSFMTGHLDYDWGCGDTKLATHSALMFPTNQLFTCCMNKTNTTAGGYPGTYYRKYAMARANAIVKACFGADHVLSHRIILPNAFNANGLATGYAWYSSICDAMNEFMVYGCRHLGPSYEWTADSYLFTTEKAQIAAFAHNPSLIVPPSGQWRWLRDPVSAACFAFVSDGGRSGRNDASGVLGVWPAFRIY